MLLRSEFKLQDRRNDGLVSIRAFDWIIRWWGELFKNPLFITRHGRKLRIRGDHDVTVSIGD